MSTQTSIVKVERRLYPRDQPATIRDKNNGMVVSRQLHEDECHKMAGNTVEYFHAVKKSSDWQLGSIAKEQKW
jgi:hypothetical protein